MSCVNCIHSKVCTKENGVNAKRVRCENFDDISQYQKIPCAVGTKVYIISFRNSIREFFVQGFRFGDIIRSSFEICIAYSWVNVDEIGKTVFFSYEEAKQAIDNTRSQPAGT